MNYVPSERRLNTGYIFPLKYICIFSTNSVNSRISSLLKKIFQAARWNQEALVRAAPNQNFLTFTLRRQLLLIGFSNKTNFPRIRIKQIFLVEIFHSPKYISVEQGLG